MSKKKAIMQYTKWTPEKREQFIECIKETGNVTQAARLLGVSRCRAYQIKEIDPEFSESWDNAYEESIDTLEKELRRRACEGVETAVGWHQGEPGGFEMKYSDTLLIFMLKSMRPEKYADRSRITHSVDDTLAERMARAKDRIKELPDKTDE